MISKKPTNIKILLIPSIKEIQAPLLLVNYRFKPPPHPEENPSSATDLNAIYCYWRPLISRFATKKGNSLMLAGNYQLLH